MGGVGWEGEGVFIIMGVKLSKRCWGKWVISLKLNVLTKDSSVQVSFVKKIERSPLKVGIPL